MTQDDVRDAIFKAFAAVPKPTAEAVLACHCAHCLPLREEFLPYSWDKVPGESVDRQSSHLSLFTPWAFQYYLPTYLLRSIEDPRGDVCIFTAYSLDDLESEWGRDRYPRLTGDQVRSITLALRYIQSVAPDDEIAGILPKWEKLASTSETSN
jgi:hypothetical protein